MAPPHILVFDLHVRLLQCMSDEASVHFQGLTQAAVFFKRKGKLDNLTVKRISNLDHCYHVLRHVTQASCDTMCNSILDKIKLDSNNNIDYSMNDEKWQPDVPAFINEMCTMKDHELPTMRTPPVEQSTPSTLTGELTSPRLSDAYPDLLKITFEETTHGKSASVPAPSPPCSAATTSQLDTLQVTIDEIINKNHTQGCGAVPMATPLAAPTTETLVTETLMTSAPSSYVSTAPSASLHVPVAPQEEHGACVLCFRIFSMPRRGHPDDCPSLCCECVRSHGGHYGVDCRHGKDISQDSHNDTDSQDSDSQDSDGFDYSGDDEDEVFFRWCEWNGYA